MKHYFSHINHSRNRELNEMYASVSLRSFAISLIGIFIPVYLYTLGFSLRTIFLFYLITNAIQFVGDYLTGHLISRFGPKHVLISSYPAMAINLLMLATIPFMHWPLWLLALSTAVSLNLFWVPYHDDFSKAKDKKSTGWEVSKFIIFSEVFGAFGPLIGGLIAQKFGFQYGILAALIIIAIAVLPLIGKKEIVKKGPIKHTLFSVKNNYKDLVAYGGLSLEGMTLWVIWPLFIFLFVKSYVRLGFIITVTLLIVVALSFFMGKITDKYKKDKVMKTGSVLGFFTASSRILTTGLTSAYVFSTISSLSQIFLYIPFYSVFYLHADKHPRTQYVSLMEMTVDVFRGILYAILYIATFFVADRWVFTIAFIFGALGALSTYFIANSEKKLGKTKEMVEVKV